MLLGDNEETTLGLLLLLLPLLLLRLLLLLLLLLLLMPHQWLPILPHRRHSRCLFSPLPLLPPQLLPPISFPLSTTTSVVGKGEVREIHPV